VEFFKANTKIDFMRQRKWAAIFSITLFVLSIGSLLFHGLNLSLDFTGGTQIQIHYQQPANLLQIRQQLDKAGFKNPIVQAYGTSQDVIIKLQPRGKIAEKEISKRVSDSLPQAKIQQVEFIGPQVGKTLLTNGILAIIVSLLATMAYIALRFEYRFAVSSAIALIHDPVLILGVFSFFHLEFSLITLAAVLTLLGFSLNDTVVVYDRVRENFRKVRKGTPTEIMNLSVNQTLSRTIMTSGLTLLVVVVLFIFGGEMLRWFSLALIIGIVIGTYSSIYVAGSLSILMGLEKQHLLPPEKRYIDDRP